MSILITVEHESYLDSEGRPEAIQPFEKIEVSTSVGNLVPIYEVEDHGRKRRTPVRLYKNGSFRSIALQDATQISTSVGNISAELVTFYESGALCRVFPLNGKLSGYWSELNEYKLTKELAIPTPIGTINVRPIYLHFYESGELRSITFWPAEKVEIQTPLGVVPIKRGISFYRSGALESCEPITPLLVDTPLGPIEAFDPDPNGMNGEKNSLAFSEKGNVVGLSTVKTVVKGKNGSRDNMTFSPLVQRSRCSDTAFTVEPLKIKFEEDAIVFRNGLRKKSSILSTAQFFLEPFSTDKNLSAVGCGS